MWSLLLNYVLPTLGTFAVGVFGWLVTNFVGRQILSFYRLREEIQEELYFTDNVALAVSGTERWEEARDDLRRLAARLQSLDVSSTWATRKYLSWRGYEVTAASGHLIGVSNTIDRSDPSNPLHRHPLERALKLPLSHTDAQITQIANRIAGRT